MTITFRQARVNDAEAIATLVVALTTEICERASAPLLNVNLDDTIHLCHELMSQGHYFAIVGESDNSSNPIAVVTMVETYALYAGGKMGVIQECYVAPDYRVTGVGSLLIAQAKEYAQKKGWSCIELCTPPLPAFERTLKFYQKNGLIPVGGRKMRQKFQ